MFKYSKTKNILLYLILILIFIPSPKLVFAEDVLVDLPTFISYPDKNIGGNNETVAGHEQMAPPEPTPPPTTQTPQPAVSVNRNNFIAVAPQPATTENNPVLGTSEIKGTQGAVNAPKGSVFVYETALQNAKFYKKSVFYYFITGALLSLILMIVLSMRRKSENS